MKKILRIDLEYNRVFFANRRRKIISQNPDFKSDIITQMQKISVASAATVERW